MLQKTKGIKDNKEKALKLAELWQYYETQRDKATSAIDIFKWVQKIEIVRKEVDRLIKILDRKKKSS